MTYQVLSERSEDFGAFFATASRVGYKEQKFPELGKFLTAYYADVIDSRVELSRENIDGFRSYLREELAKMKLLLVGIDSPYKKYFGQVDKIDDLLFMNYVTTMMSGRSERQTPIGEYDLIVARSLKLRVPSFASIVELKDKTTKENKDLMYWYEMEGWCEKFSRVVQLITHEQFKGGLETLLRETGLSLVNQKSVPTVAILKALVELKEIDYQERFINAHLKKRGVLIDCEYDDDPLFHIRDYEKEAEGWEKIFIHLMTGEWLNKEEKPKKSALTLQDVEIVKLPVSPTCYTTRPKKLYKRTD